MTVRIFNEQENRRGLVLGLTIAEILILVLFVLMLAFGARFKSLEEKAEAAQTFEDEVRGLVGGGLEPGAGRSENLKASRSGDFESALLKLRFLVTKVKKLEQQLNELTAGSEAIRADSTMRRKVGSAIAIAKQINPDDPPAALTIAIEDLRGRKSEANLRNDERRSGMDSKAGQTKLDGGSLGSQLKSSRPKEASGTDGDSERGHNWPPIISLSEADGYFFASGSASLPSQFQSALHSKVVPKLLQMLDRYDVNVIEVVGHTDEQPVGKRWSNLDKVLVPYLLGQLGENRISPADNAGLGLSRAVSVSKVLINHPDLASFKILPLSGAQLIDIDDSLAGDSTGAPLSMKERRRIEIRVRRSDKVRSPGSPGSRPNLTRDDSPSQIVYGLARAIDGDTLKIRNKRIRIWGIDAIEAAQKCRRNGAAWNCAEEAVNALRKRVRGQSIACRPIHKDQFDRVVAKCFLRGDDLGSWLVQNGWALDYKEYSMGAYNSLQREAQKKRLGIWQGTFELPWNWRRKTKSPRRRPAQKSAVRPKQDNWLDQIFASD